MNLRSSVGQTRLVAGLVVFTIVALAAPSRADFLEAMALYRGGKYAECIESLDKAIAEEVTSENERSLKIRAELALGRYKDARETVEEGLKKLPGSLELRSLGREVCRYSNDADRAKELETQIANL